MKLARKVRPERSTRTNTKRETTRREKGIRTAPAQTDRNRTRSERLPAEQSEGLVKLILASLNLPRCSKCGQPRSLFDDPFKRKKKRGRPETPRNREIRKLAPTLNNAQVAEILAEGEYVRIKQELLAENYPEVQAEHLAKQEAKSLKKDLMDRVREVRRYSNIPNPKRYRGKTKQDFPRGKKTV